MNDLDPPRMVDAFSVIAKSLQRKLERYPKDSLTPRSELVMLPVFDEVSFCKVDAALTKSMYDAAVAKRDITDGDLRQAALSAIGHQPSKVIPRTFKGFRKLT